MRGSRDASPNPPEPLNEVASGRGEIASYITIELYEKYGLLRRSEIRRERYSFSGEHIPSLLEDARPHALHIYSALSAKLFNISIRSDES